MGNSIKINYCPKCYGTDILEGSNLCLDCYMQAEGELQEYYESLEEEKDEQ